MSKIPWQYRVQPVSGDFWAFKWQAKRFHFIPQHPFYFSVAQIFKKAKQKPMQSPQDIGSVILFLFYKRGFCAVLKGKIQIGASVKRKTVNLLPFNFFPINRVSPPFRAIFFLFDPAPTMFSLAALNTCIVIKFLEILRRHQVSIGVPIEFQGNTLSLFAPDLECLTLWQNHSLQIIAAAHLLGITHVRLHDRGLALDSVTVNIPDILGTSTGVEVRQLMELFSP